MSYKYKMKYNLDNKAGEYTKEQLIESGDGGCDAFIFVSMLFPPNGSFSCVVMGRDGRKESGELDDIDMHRVWLSMASHLSESKNIPDFHRFLAKQAFKSMQVALNREQKEQQRQ